METEYRRFSSRTLSKKGTRAVAGGVCRITEEDRSMFKMRVSWAEVSGLAFERRRAFEEGGDVWM